MSKIDEVPTYRDEDRDYQWWLSTKGDKVRLTVEYRRVPHDQRLWRALDLLQQGATPRKEETAGVN